VSVVLYGIEFPDDEADLVIVNGQPEWVINRAGVRRAAKHAPNQEIAARLLAYLDTLPPTPNRD
jgi:hypothetical protein